MSPTVAQYAAAVEEVRDALFGIMPLLREIAEEEPARPRTRVISQAIERASLAIGPLVTATLGTGPFTWPDIVVIDKRGKPPTDAPSASTMGDLLAALERGEHLGIRCYGDVTYESLATLARDLLRLSLVILNRSEEMKAISTEERR